MTTTDTATTDDTTAYAEHLRRDAVTQAKQLAYALWDIAHRRAFLVPREMRLRALQAQVVGWAWRVDADEVFVAEIGEELFRRWLDDDPCILADCAAVVTADEARGDDAFPQALPRLEEIVAEYVERRSEI